MTCIDGIDGNGKQAWVCDRCHGDGCPDPRDAEIQRLAERVKEQQDEIERLKAEGLRQRLRGVCEGYDAAKGDEC